MSQIRHISPCPAELKVASEGALAKEVEDPPQTRYIHGPSVLRQASPASGSRLMGSQCQTVDLPPARRNLSPRTPDGTRIACLDSRTKECKKCWPAYRARLKRCPFWPPNTTCCYANSSLTCMRRRGAAVKEPLYILFVSQDLDVLIAHLLAFLVHCRDLERLVKSAYNLRKAGDAVLSAAILKVPLLLLMGSKDQA